MSKKDFLEIPEDIKYAVLLKGLNENVIKRISWENNEPAWMLEHRLFSYKIFQQKTIPTWGPDISDIDFDKIVFFAKPEAIQQYATNWEDVDPQIKEKFERLGIPEAERQHLAGAGGQYDSSVFYHKIKEKWEKLGIIFEDMNEAVHKHPKLIQKHFMKIVPPEDHKFAALHGAVRSGGTFIYIPSNVKLQDPLQAYFRMNALNGGQFEHTLIITEDNTKCEYIEGCSAPKLSELSLHVGCVEISVGKNSEMKYSSVENWSLNTYNLNTKRAIVQENSIMNWVSGNLGSGKTMLYPMSILKGNNSKSYHLGVVLASNGQNQDIGSKVLHIGKNSSSEIISKSICKDGGINTYRGMVKILPSATGSINKTECDAMLIDDKSVSDTIPNIECLNADSTVAHEASSGKIDEKTLFYLMCKGIEKQKAAGMIVNGFVSDIIKKLPLEYAGEMNKLIDMEMEGSVG